ncbi:MAG: cupin domain-containing protein [Polyangiaceae bacterium]
MILFEPANTHQFQAVAPGVEFCHLRRHADAGLTLLVRMQQGAHARLHEHAGGEETYLISGKLRVGAHLLQPGDYLWTPPGVAHDGFAEEQSLFFVVLPGGIQVVSSAS